MGGSQTKCHANGHEVRILKEKTKLLQQKLNEMMCLRETESEVHDQEVMVHALKESEWKRERKWLQKEVRRLRKVLEDREQRNRREAMTIEKKSEKVALHELEQMREDRAQRDEAVEKWKRLYLAIKIELDNLINRTPQGETGSWREDGEYLIDELRREVKAKEETIELLQAHIASIEQEQSRREREVDILRQSLRIMSHKKKPKNISTGFSRNLQH
uniref:golgin subfamily A member 6-like protein 22 n=1 Tax=Erigeron canadensis TaxID=72917 RepID=UPI001CB9D618|nr:golgin subfamily A member 6-like protein 22 [Erigeron canadensis]